MANMVSPISTKLPTQPAPSVHKTDDYAVAYEQSEKFIGLMLGKIFTPLLDMSMSDEDGDDGHCSHLLEFFDKSVYGEALAKDQAFHPIKSEMAYGLLKYQEAQNV